MEEFPDELHLATLIQQCIYRWGTFRNEAVPVRDPDLPE